MDKTQVIEMIQEYRDESLNQGLEGWDENTFTAILDDLIMYIREVA